ncbi:MAG: nucleotide exchange factor GrpE [Methylovulum sp.]|jgi:molecular chaperone GrpE|nr:nucleotide exchange factor GrpE [Methylovulum sp.]
MTTEQENIISGIDEETTMHEPLESEVSADNVINEQAEHTEIIEHEYTIDELKQELAIEKAKATEHWEKVLRIQADMDNLKKRTKKDLEDAHKFALTNFAKELLPVLDSLVLGLHAANGDSDEVNKFRQGSELTIKQFESALARFNIETIDPVGQLFNAEHHQAMAMQEVEGAAPNTVVNVFQKGYLLNGRLLRPAMVVVAKTSIDTQA